MQTKNFFISAALILTALILSGCSIGNSSSSGTNNMPLGSANIQISNITTIPTTNFTPGEYTLANITNNSDKNITLQNTIINANGKIVPSAIIPTFIDLSNCMQISAHTSCNFKVFTNPVFQSYLLNLTYSDNANSYNINQVISFNALLPTQNGFIYDATQLSVDNSGLTIPFRLANNYNNISILINNQPAEFSCYKNNYNLNTLCTANIKTNNITGAVKGVNSVKIIGYNSNGTIKNNVILVLTNTQAANIITSGTNVVINPDDGTSPQTVYLVNNGLATASGLTITPQMPITISSNTCGTTLAANANCSFVINVSGSPTSGQGSVAVSYSNGNNTQLLYFNVSYANQVTPGLTLTTSGSFINVVESIGPTYIAVNVSNTGSNNLTNLQFSNLSLQKPNMSSFAIFSTCSNGKSLAVGQSCLMTLSYLPFTTESGSVNFIPTASYTESGGQTITYANSILNIAYSAIVNNSFVAVGDYGMVISSTAGSPGTWSANVDSPFAPGESATGWDYNPNVGGQDMALMLNSGKIKYTSLSTPFLFWKSATTNLNASTCDLIYTGADFNYYTCGTTSSTNGSCIATPPRGCLLRSTSAAGPWSGVYQPGASVNFYSVYSTFSNVFVTIANTTANGGVAFGNTNAGFSAATTGTTAGNSNMLGLAYNSNNNTVTAWATTGFSATGNGNGSGWSTNTSNRPTNSPVRGATVNNGGTNYAVATAAGNIYTTPTPATGTTYTTVYTGSVQLNDVKYNLSNNSYEAVGNNGLLIESDGANGGTWYALPTVTIGESTIPNLTRIVQYNPLTAGIVILGTSTLMYTKLHSNNIQLVPGLRAITKAGNNYLAIDNQNGSPDQIASNYLYTSSDLVNWSATSNLSSSTTIYCASATLCFIGNNSGNIYKSTDGGNNWIIVYPSFSGRINSIICLFNLCVAVGGSGNPNDGVAITSTNDFSSWTLQSSSLPTWGLNDVTVYNNSTFIAVGESGTMFSSTNGKDWSSINPGTTNRLASIACGNLGVGCVAVGDNGTIVFSANGTTGWTAKTSGTTNDLTSVAYSGGTFVAVGKSSTIKTSANGTTWSNGTFPATSSNLNNLWAVINK